MENKYIIGYTAVEYNIQGILIPKKTYTEFERQHGKKPYTEVTEAELERLNNDKVFCTLLKNKMLRILDHIPNFALSGEDRANRKLAEAEKQHAEELAKLKAELEATKVALAELEATKAAEANKNEEVGE